MDTVHIRYDDTVGVEGWFFEHEDQEGTHPHDYALLAGTGQPDDVVERCARRWASYIGLDLVEVALEWHR